MSLRISIPMKLPSLANVRMHWRAMDRLKKSQKNAVAICFQGQRLPSLPATITITRLGKRKLDSDNLQSAGKYVRDAIARCYGVDDGSELYQWRYEQRIADEYGVEIQIEEQAI